jgi:hypothetical protein
MVYLGEFWERPMPTFIFETITDEQAAHFFDDKPQRDVMIIVAADRAGPPLDLHLGNDTISFNPKHAFQKSDRPWDESSRTGRSRWREEQRRLSQLAQSRLRKSTCR